MRVVVLLALTAMLARVFAAYVVPEFPEFAAIAVIGVVALIAALGGDVPRYGRRMLAGLLAVAGAAFVAVCLAVGPPGVEPAVRTYYPVGWLTSAAGLFALFTVLDRNARPRTLLLRIAAGTAAAVGVAWAALHQAGPFRLGLSDTPFSDVLVVAEAASLRTMLSGLVIIVVPPTLLAVLVAARRELGTLHDGPPARFAVFGGLAATVGAAVFSPQQMLLVASIVAISAALFGWARQWFTSRGRLASGSG